MYFYFNTKINICISISNWLVVVSIDSAGHRAGDISLINPMSISISDGK